MDNLKPVKSGWKAMERILNGFVSSINRRTLIQGSGISLDETDEGVILSTTNPENVGNSGTSSGTSPDLITPDGDTASWQQIQVLTGTTIYTMWVWGGPPKNPVSCSGGL